MQGAKYNLYALPARSSQLMQPLDVGIFKILKAQWKRAVKEYSDAEIITKKTFANTTSKYLAATVFRKNGLLYPLDANNIEWSKVVTPETVSVLI